MLLSTSELRPQFRENIEIFLCRELIAQAKANPLYV